MKKQTRRVMWNRTWRMLMAIMLLSGSVLFIPKSSHAATPFNVNAKSAILVDAKTGKILYEKNPDQQLPPASMTKMMTEYLVLKALNDKKITWDTVVPVSDKVQSLSRETGFSGFSLRTDYKYTVRSMLDALLIPSSNAAAMAFADLLAGNEVKFVDQMNQTAQALGMKDTTYINSSGLDNVDLGTKYIAQGGPTATDLTTARDLAILGYHILNDFPSDLSNQVLQIASTAKKDFDAGPGEVTHMVSTNWMLTDFSQYGPNMKKYEYQGVDGFKTGFTGLAGYCFTGTAVRGERRLISVVMGVTDDQGNLLTTSGKNGVNEGERFLVTKQLFDYGFGQTAYQTVIKSGYTFSNQKTLPVTKGKDASVPIAVKQSLTLPVPSGEKDQYKLVLHLDKSLLDKNGQLKAPVKKGQKVGYATIENTGPDKYGYIMGQPTPLDVVTTTNVEKASWFTLLFRGIGHLFSGIFHHK